MENSKPLPRWLLYAHLMRIHKPIGILLLLWPTLWGLWLAGEGQPAPLVVLVFVAGVVLMRSAGCVINDYADREASRALHHIRHAWAGPRQEHHAYTTAWTHLAAARLAGLLPWLDASLPPSDTPPRRRPPPWPPP